MAYHDNALWARVEQRRAPQARSEEIDMGDPMPEVEVGDWVRARDGLPMLIEVRDVGVHNDQVCAFDEYGGGIVLDAIAEIRKTTERRWRRAAEVSLPDAAAYPPRAPGPDDRAGALGRTLGAGRVSRGKHRK